MTDIYYYVTALFGEGQTYRKKRYGAPAGVIFWQKRSFLKVSGGKSAATGRKKRVERVFQQSWNIYAWNIPEISTLPCW
jgi:hypothetical protein